MRRFFGVRPEALSPKGYEYVATSAPKRPVAVRFSREGDALYVVDITPTGGPPAATSRRVQRRLSLPASPSRPPR